MSEVADAAPAGPVELATVGQLADYLQRVSELNAAGTQLWFRGVRKASYPLVPSLFRHPSHQTPDEFLLQEWQLLTEFKQRAQPFVGPLPRENVELLFMMQHYGVPTRLLDWTENPLVALFFALENARRPEAVHDDAGIWVINPARMNEIGTATKMPPARQVLNPSAAELSAYLPRQQVEMINESAPLAIYGIHNSTRIVAQRGGFVIFGRDQTPMDQRPQLAGVVQRIKISAAAKLTMFAELSRLGMSDSVIYPDLDGLGRELRNRWGF